MIRKESSPQSQPSELQCSAFFAGKWISVEKPLSERLAAIFAIGAIGMMIGAMWGWVFPINKNIWTSSYVVFTAGMACVTLGVCIWLVDEKKITGWTQPFVIFGMNPILAFVGSGVMARIIYSIWKVQYDGKEIPVQAAMYKSVFEPLFEPKTASFLFSLAFTGFWLVILWVLYRKRIFLKV